MPGWEDDDDWNDGDGDDWDDRYDYEEDGEEDEEGEATGPCPECHAPMHVDAEACPACGHWLSVAERHRMWDGSEGAIKSLGKWLIVVLLIAVMTAFLFLPVW